LQKLKIAKQSNLEIRRHVPDAAEMRAYIKEHAELAETGKVE